MKHGSEMNYLEIGNKIFGDFYQGMSIKIDITVEFNDCASYSHQTANKQFTLEQKYFIFARILGSRPK